MQNNNIKMAKVKQVKISRSDIIKVITVPAGTKKLDYILRLQLLEVMNHTFTIYIDELA